MLLSFFFLFCVGCAAARWDHNMVRVPWYEMRGVSGAQRNLWMRSFCCCYYRSCILSTEYALLRNSVRKNANIYSMKEYLFIN